VLPAVAALETALEPFGTRPHWGKVFGTAPATVASLWPHLSDFANLTLKHDREGKFRNAMLETYLPR
jgi:alditol oxidase